MPTDYQFTRSSKDIVKRLKKADPLICEKVKNHFSAVWAISLEEYLDPAGAWWIQEGQTKHRVYWLPKITSKFLEEICQSPVFGGLFVGAIKENIFQVSLSILTHLLKPLTPFFVDITDQGVHEFLTTHYIQSLALRLRMDTYQFLEMLKQQNILLEKTRGIIISSQHQPIGLCKIKIDSTQDPKLVRLIPLDTIAKYLRSGY